MLQTIDDKTEWQTLISDARDGCDDALGQILIGVQDYLLLIAKGELGSRVQAKFGASDVVQHSMLEARDAIAGFRGSSEAEFCRWLKKIVIHNLTDESRRYTHTQARNVRRETSSEGMPASLQQSHMETPSWHISRSEADEQLAKAVARLPRRQRYVVEARHKLGHGYSQIASHLCISEEGARKLWSRAAEQLRIWLEPAE